MTWPWSQILYSQYRYVITEPPPYPHPMHLLQLLLSSQSFPRVRWSWWSVRWTITSTAISAGSPGLSGLWPGRRASVPAAWHWTHHAKAPLSTPPGRWDWFFRSPCPRPAASITCAMWGFPVACLPGSASSTALHFPTSSLWRWFPLREGRVVAGQLNLGRKVRYMWAGMHCWGGKLDFLKHSVF